MINLIDHLNAPGRPGWVEALPDHHPDRGSHPLNATPIRSSCLLSTMTFDLTTHEGRTRRDLATRIERLQDLSDRWLPSLRRAGRWRSSPRSLRGSPDQGSEGSGRGGRHPRPPLRWERVLSGLHLRRLLSFHANRLARHSPSPWGLVLHATHAGMDYQPPGRLLESCQHDSTLPLLLSEGGRGTL